ncbi:hypothetical protein [Ruegeria atlantica]|uniref:hypothetical protein n=1 Tax=Ruegeria atlantica TaxID=81569 RepID=UPI00147E9A79|nr:hypothetical protein [Ruegeria atlantica]
MKTTISAIILGLSTMTAQAEIQNYDCQLHSMEDQGWIPPRVLLSVDAPSNRARAYDGHISGHNDLAGIHEDTPIDAKFKTTRKGEYRLNWRLTLSTSNSRRVRIFYTATIDPKTNKLRMSARFPMDNVTNRPSGEGRCEPVKSWTLY